MRSSVVVVSSVNASFNTTSRNARIHGMDPELYSPRGARPVKARGSLESSSSLGSSRLHYRLPYGLSIPRVTKSSPERRLARSSRERTSRNEFPSPAPTPLQGLNLGLQSPGMELVRGLPQAPLAALWASYPKKAFSRGVFPF